MIALLAVAAALPLYPQAPGKPDKLFARYDLTPASCKGITFDS
jgi:hypothetical protein